MVWNSAVRRFKSGVFTWSAMVVTYGLLAMSTVFSPVVNAVEYSFDPTFTTYGKEVTLNWTMWLPDEVSTIRGLVFIAGAQDSTRNQISLPYWQRAARSLGFGLVGNEQFLGKSPERWAGATAEETQQIVQSVLDAAATASGHPELSNVPIALTGISNGGGQSMLVAARVPNRVLGYASLRSGLPSESFLPSFRDILDAEEAFAEVPGVFILGSNDDVFWPEVMKDGFGEWRQQENLRHAFEMVWGSNHLADDFGTADGRYQGLSWDLSWYWMSEASRLRYPEGQLPSLEPNQPLMLNHLDMDSGWLGETPTFTPTVSASSDPGIYPATSYPGDVAKASWLPSESAANVYRAVTAVADQQYIAGNQLYPGPMTFTSPSYLQDPLNPDYLVGDTIPIRIDPHEFDDEIAIHEMQFYDGDMLIGTDTEGPDWGITYVPDDVGVRGLTAVAINDVGTRTYSFRAVPVLPWTAHRTLSASPTAIYSVADDFSDSHYDNLGDTARDEIPRGLVSVGEVDSESENQVVRLIAKFELPAAEPRLPTLERATLRFFVFADSTAGAQTGPLSLFHSIDDNDADLNTSDYEDLTYTDTFLDLLSSPLGSKSRYYELDVTELVKADYAFDEDILQSAFRLQVDDSLFLEDGTSHHYRLYMPKFPASRPELVLTFVPEPTANALWGVGMLGLIGRRRRAG